MPLWESMPLSGSDLRAIADAVDEVESTTLAANKVIGRVEIYRPDCGDRIGWVDRFDQGDPDMGWGFLPDTDHLEDVM